MKQLIVRNVAPPLVNALKRRAAKLGHSAEEEHRRILESALKGPPRKTLIEALSEMPAVGLDSDFARQH